MDIATLNDALGRLRAKYGLPQGAIVSGTPWPLLQLPSGQEIPLLRWRAERRFTELKNIIDGGTLEGVSTLRFATFRDGGDLLPLLAAELDLACHLTGSRIVRLYAVMAPGNRACNVILRLENGVSGCVECGVGLPAGTAPVDRHEVIARRGVASDRTVDTQVPQSSIYLWGEQGARTYTDTDFELYGLPDEGIWTVRAAYAILLHPELGDLWREAGCRCLEQAKAALKAAKQGETVEF